MTNRTITKLFAVGALAISAQASASPDTTSSKPRTLPNGRPACGNVMTKGPRPPCVETTTAARPAPPPPPAIPAAAPRTLPTGAPACGNVNSKSGDADCKPVANARAARVARAVRSRADALMVTAAAGAAVVQPRVLATGAPACGNVVRGKGSTRRTCTTEALLTVPSSPNDLVARIAATSAESYLAAIAPRSTALPGRATQTASVPMTMPVRTRTDGSIVITPRMLANGAPACGNVLGKGSSENDPAYRACIIENQPGPMTAQRAIDIASVWPTNTRPAIDVALAAIESHQPRELASGAPACGNVASRAPRPCKTIAANAK